MAVVTDDPHKHYQSGDTRSYFYLVGYKDAKKRNWCPPMHEVSYSAYKMGWDDCKGDLAMWEAEWIGCGSLTGVL